MRISASNSIWQILFLLTIINLAGMSSRPLYVTPSDKYHIVQQGDTLSRISRQSGVSVADLMLFNDLESDRIEIGQKIYYAPHKAGKRIYITERKIPPDKIHRVEKGEDLSIIAQIYGLDLLDLVHYNNITSWELEEGKEIYLSENIQTVATKPSPVKKPGKVSAAPAAKVAVKTAEPAAQPRAEEEISAPGQLQYLPVETYKITRRFNKTERHQGIDLAAPAGTPVYAVYDGTVVYSGVQKGYGNLVILEHADRLMTVYAHNETNIVETGESIKAGEKIASVGSTGRSSGNHLHFEIRKAGQPLDPEPYLKKIGR
ncbi:MAG: peptidoglycan DD-metalloendopeptidase family protein [Candidatus Cloacimonetes bacterium]|nr:peptidoglycan DD-metalloendopeptidase family protein [Candidatus Cloacimonadota bacterium]